MREQHKPRLWEACVLCIIGLIVLAAGCASRTADQQPPTDTGQTLSQALSLVCEVDARAGLDPNDDVLDVAQKRSDWIRARVKNPDAIYLTTIWRVQPANERAKSLREHALDAGIKQCPYADSLEREGEL